MRARWVLALIVACGAPEPVPRAPPLVEEPAVRAPTPALVRPLRPGTRQVFQQTLDRVIAARGLNLLQAVPCEEVDRATLLRLVREHVAREVPSAAIRAEGLVHELLGDFPQGADYEAATYAFLEQAVAGYYESANRTMYLARDLDPEETRSTLSHELVHALDDQHWDLGARAAYTDGEDDRDTAVSALAEGDATSVGVPLVDAASVVPLADALASEPLSGTQRSLQRSLLAPYVVGTRFVEALRREGGWATVDLAWRRPPETTEQILHPEKWRSHEPADLVPAPPPPSSDLPLAHATTYGELGVLLALDAWMDTRVAVESAAGWGGDRLALYRLGDRAALSWHIRFDAEAFASRAFTALTVALSRLGHAANGRSGPLCVERGTNGALALSREGRDVYLSVGTVAIEATRWRAVMTCDEALAWNDVARRAALTAPARTGPAPRIRPTARSGETGREPSRAQ